jgi:hypothetical protein
MLKKKQLNEKINNRLTKRGFALQFSWIFVLIGGAIFLGFFISLIRNLDVGESQQTSQESTQELDSLLRISSAVSDTQKIVLFKAEKEIIFSCIDEVSEYRIEGAIKSARYDYNVIFSPDKLRDDEMVIQASVFEAPFRVIPVVYLTDKKIEYVFVGNSPLINIIFNSMPSGAIKKSISRDEFMNNYPDNNYDHVVFVLDDDDEDLLGVYLSQFNNAKNRVFAVMFTTYGNIDWGEIKFYKYVSNSFTLDGSKVPFLETSLDQQKSILALGGVISHNREIYECNLKKMLRRLALMAELHNQRLNVYKDYYATAPTANTPLDCNQYYRGAQGNLSIMAYAEEPALSLGDFMNTRVAINYLESINRLIMILGDCARIY